MAELKWRKRPFARADTEEVEVSWTQEDNLQNLFLSRVPVITDKATWIIIMLSYGFRISLRIRESNCRQNIGLGFCTSKFFQLTSFFMVRPLSVAIIGENYNQRLRRRLVSSSSLQSKPPGELPLLSECFRFFSIPFLSLFFLFN